MKTPTLITLALSLSHAGTALAGGSSDGGGNAVCNSQTHACKMVEQFQVTDLSQVKGFELYNAKMELLRKELPELAARIDKGVANKTWYVIPRDFDELRRDQTKLRFDTTQAAYQNDSEVFLSQNALDQMDEEGAAYKLMHESIMSTQDVRDPIPVRAATGKIMAKGANPLTIQEAVAKARLGVYFTPGQMTAQRRQLQIAYLDHVAGILEEANQRCTIAQWNPDYESYMRREYAKNPQGRAKYELEQLTDKLNAWPENNKFFGVWNSPFSSSPQYGGGLLGAKARWNSNEVGSIKFGFADVTKAHPEIATPGFAEWEANFSVNNPNHNGVEEGIRQGYYRKLEDGVEKDSFRIIQRLGTIDAFVDLLAIQMRQPRADVKELSPDFYAPNKDAVEKAYQIAPILDSVKARLNSVPRDASSQLVRLCSDVSALQGEVAGLKGVLENKYNPKPHRERQQDDLFGNDDDGYGKARQKAPVKELGDPAL
jgi:hypothetical protein